jgi:hypothetical protein
MQKVNCLFEDETRSWRMLCLRLDPTRVMSVLGTAEKDEL